MNLQLDDAPPVLLQTAPFLRHGIVSSVHPFPIPLPHGFTIDVPSQGGASGSPIFRPADAAVVGMIYAAFEEGKITYALPAGLVSVVVKTFLERRAPMPGAPTLAEYSKNPEAVYELKYGRPTLLKSAVKP